METHRGRGVVVEMARKTGSAAEPVIPDAGWKAGAGRILGKALERARLEKDGSRCGGSGRGSSVAGLRRSVRWWCIRFARNAGVRRRRRGAEVEAVAGCGVWEGGRDGCPRCATRRAYWEGRGRRGVPESELARAGKKCVWRMYSRDFREVGVTMYPMYLA